VYARTETSGFVNCDDHELAKVRNKE